MPNDPWPAMAGAVDAMSSCTEPPAFFAALEQAMAQAIGHRLFTVMHHDAAAGRNRRVYSNEPEHYAIAGFKTVDWHHPWARHVIVEGRAWLGHSPADIAWAYPDHQKIIALGLGSAMNFPLRFAGRTLGSVNLLDAPGRYSQAECDRGRIIAALAIPWLLAPA